MKAKFVFDELICSTESMDELKPNHNILFYNSVTKFRDLEHKVEHKSRKPFKRKNNPRDLWVFLQSMKWIRRRKIHFFLRKKFWPTLKSVKTVQLQICRK